MKKILLLLSLFLSLLSCEDVIEVDLPTSTPRLVIDAVIEKQLTPEGELIAKEALVKLSLTTPFFNEEDNFVNDAEVILINTVNNEVFNLENTGFGNYRVLNQQFNLEEDSSFRLQVVYQNEAYESEATLVPSSPFNAICQVKNESQINEGVAVEIAFNDIPDQPNFYFLDLGDNNFTTIDDDFFIDGEEIKFTFFFDENVTLDHLFRIHGSTERFNNFADALLQLSGGDGNGPFSTVPFQARGNIVNTSNPDNFPFGFFRINETYSLRVQLEENENFENK